MSPEEYELFRKTQEQMAAEIAAQVARDMHAEIVRRGLHYRSDVRYFKSVDDLLASIK